MFESRPIDKDYFAFGRRMILCPYCGRECPVVPHNAVIYKHLCGEANGPVFFLNGVALSGAGTYNAHEKSTRKQKPEKP